MDASAIKNVDGKFVLFFKYVAANKKSIKMYELSTSFSNRRLINFEQKSLKLRASRVSSKSSTKSWSRREIFWHKYLSLGEWGENFFNAIHAELRSLKLFNCFDNRMVWLRNHYRCTGGLNSLKTIDWFVFLRKNDFFVRKMNFLIFSKIVHGIFDLDGQKFGVSESRNEIFHRRDKIVARFIGKKFSWANGKKYRIFRTNLLIISVSKWYKRKRERRRDAWE